MRVRRPRAASRRGAILSAVVVAGVVALVVAIAVDASRTAGEPRPDRGRGEERSAELLVGPDTPQPGALPGRLIVAEGPGCRLRSLDLATMRLGRRGPATDCRLWSSPDGERVVVATREAEPPFLQLALVVRDGREWQVDRRLGRSASPVAWAADGARLAWCDGRGTIVAAAEARDETRRRVTGCYPTFAADGTVVTRVLDAPSLIALRDGEPWFRAGEPTTAPGEGFVGLIRALGIGALPDGRIAVASVDLGEPGTSRLALFRDAAEETSIPLATPETRIGPGTYGLRIDVSPTGGELAVRYPGDLTYAGPDRLVGLTDLRSRSALPLPSGPVRGLAWSPDGTWLAVSTGSDVLVYGPGRIDPTYVLPLPAADVAWVED